MVSTWESGLYGPKINTNFPATVSSAAAVAVVTGIVAPRQHLPANQTQTRAKEGPRRLSPPRAARLVVLCVCRPTTEHDSDFLLSTASHHSHRPDERTNGPFSSSFCSNHGCCCCRWYRVGHACLLPCTYCLFMKSPDHINIPHTISRLLYILLLCNAPSSLQHWHWYTAAVRTHDAPSRASSCSPRLVPLPSHS